MIKYSNWALIVIWCLAAFSCSSTKELIVDSNKVDLQNKCNTLPKDTENEQVKTVSFASMVETPNHFDLKETENTPLFKAIPDSVLEYVPTIAEQRQSLEEEQNDVFPKPFYMTYRNPNYYGRTSLTLGIIAIITGITIYGPLICGIIAIKYSYKSRRAGEPDQSLGKTGKTLGILALVLLPFFILSYVWALYFFGF